MDQIRQQRTRNPSGMTESMTRLHQQLEDNLKKKTDEIMRVKSQKKDLELKLEGFKSKSRRLTQLTTEIEGMKQQVVALKRSAQQTQRQHKQELEEKKQTGKLDVFISLRNMIIVAVIISTLYNIVFSYLIVRRRWRTSGSTSGSSTTACGPPSTWW